MHFVHSLNEGGIERLLYELCRKINKDRFEIQICCIKESGKLFNEFVKLGVKIHNLEAEKQLTIRNTYKNLLVLIFLRKLLIKESIDITHGHEFYSTVFSRLSAVISGVSRRYITLHNMYFWWSKKVHFVQKVLSFITTKIICNSNSTLQYSLIHDKIPLRKYKLIYNGIDCNKFFKKDITKKKILEELGFDENVFICLSVGNISKRKGFQYLVKAANYLRSKYENVRYIILGGEHHEEKSEYRIIKNMISEYKLSDIIKITGHRNDVNNLLNLCDLYIMPSVVEGFGLALAEAMSTEKIVLASDIDPFREIVTDEFNGYLFKSEDYLSLSYKIDAILTLDENVAENIRINARKTILSRFSLEEMVQNYEMLYNYKKF